MICADLQIQRSIAHDSMYPAVIIGAEHKANGERLFDALQ
jgi:hypothetical protein